MTAGKQANTVRLVLGFLIAPAVVPIAGAAVLLGCLSLRSASGVDMNPLVLLMGLPGVTGITLVASYAGAICFGVPYVLYLRKESDLNFHSVMAPPALVAVVLGLFAGVSLPFVLYPGDSSWVWAMLLGMYVAIAAAPGAVGVLAGGLCFYFIALWRSPVGPARQSAAAALAAARKDGRI